MFYTLKLVWTYDHTEGDRDLDQTITAIWYGKSWTFNTATNGVAVSEGPLDGGLIFSQDQGSDPPENESLPTDTPFYSYVDGATRWEYFHDGQGGAVGESTTLVATYTATKVTCFGARTGTASVTASAGIGGFTYAWADSPSTAADREGLGAGTYTCTVKDAGGATVVLTIVVEQNPRLDVLVHKSDKAVRLLVSGGVAPYQFLWDDGPTTAERTDLAAAEYACIVTDALGCQAVTVTVSIRSFNYYFSRNPILLALDAGNAYRADPSTKPNLSFRCQVWIEPEYLSGEYVQVGTTLEQPADRAGRTVFQVQALLDSYLDYHVPAVGQATITRADPLFRRFYLVHGESFGTPPVPGPMVNREENYVLKGGLDFYEQPSGAFASTYQDAVRPFLTWQPREKVVALDQPEFLYFQVLEPSLAEFQVRALVRYSDGSSAAVGGATQAGGLRYEVYCLPVGFAQLGLADLPGRQVASWEVFVVDENGVVLSEKRHYVLDRRPVGQRRYLLYATSLGGMATFAAAGEAEYEVEVTGEELPLSLPAGYDPQRGDTAVLQRQLRPVLKLASGLGLDRAALLGLQELLLSPRVLLLNGPRWLAGYLKTSRTPLVGDTPKLRTLDLDFYLPRQQLFTPWLPPVAAGDVVLPVGPDSGAL